MPERAHPDVKVRRSVRNWSSRNRARIGLIVLHDTEGANIRGIRDLQGLAGWFDNASSQASSHVGVDGEGQSSRMVDDGHKAWHCAYWNSPSLGIEQIGFATQRAWPDKQLRETARWIATWSRHHDVPIRRAAVTRDGRLTRTGVITHNALGNLGGGHHDPGTHYPLTKVLEYARHYRKLQESR